MILCTLITAFISKGVGDSLENSECNKYYHTEQHEAFKKGFDFLIVFLIEFQAFLCKVVADNQEGCTHIDVLNYNYRNV